MRRKIIQLFGGFLCVMLVFTFLSRAADGTSVARVTTRRTMSGFVNHTISGSGRVEALRERAVSTEDGQIVKTIYVEEGQTVEKGDLLFDLDLDELQEQLLNARQELKKLKLQNQDTESQKAAQEQQDAFVLARAAQDYQETASGNADAVADAWAAYEAASKALSDYIKNGGDSDDSSAGEDTVESALLADVADKEAELRAAEDALETLNIQIELAVQQARSQAESSRSLQNSSAESGVQTGLSLQSSWEESDTASRDTQEADAQPVSEGEGATVQHVSEGEESAIQIIDGGEEPTVQTIGEKDEPVIQIIDGKEAQPDSQEKNQNETQGTEQTEIQTEPQTLDPPVRESAEQELHQPGEEIPQETSSGAELAGTDSGETESSGSDLLMTAVSDNEITEMGSDEAAQSESEAPKTESPATVLSETEPPKTEAPAPETSETEPPETQTPVTELPETEPPKINIPETEAPAPPASSSPSYESPAPETGGQGSDNPIVIDPGTSAPEDSSSSETPDEAESRIRESYSQQKEQAQKAVQEASQALDEANAALNTYEASKEQEAENGEDTRKQQLLANVQETKDAYDAAVAAEQQGNKAAARQVEDANTPKGSDSTAEINEITEQQQELAISKLEELEAAGGEVKAPVSGIVTKINIVTGERTPDGTAVMMAEDAAGTKLSFLVSKEQEKYVSKGDTVSILPSGSQNAITDYTVSSVEEDTEETDMIRVTVNLPKGALEIGTAAEAEITKQSENYTQTIPLQAVYEDMGRNYVLVVQETTGILGTEYQASRVDVTVLDKNDTIAALQDGSLSSDQMVIISADRVIQDGSRVRIEEGGEAA